MKSSWPARVQSILLRSTAQGVGQVQVVADGGDEFAVGGLAAVGVGGVAEVMLQDIGVAANSANLNGMADGALYPGGSGMKCSGHIGIEGFGDRGAVSGIMEH